MRKYLSLVQFVLSSTVLLTVHVSVCTARADAPHDSRNIQTGSVIYRHGYCDQPYVVITADGNWLCVFTTGSGHEGQRGQHVVASASSDKGATWSAIVPIESSSGPEASWAMPLVTPSGRVYVFYDYNGDDIRTDITGRPIRADMLGWYCCKYSDDSGQTWSSRYRLPVRVTACDRGNQWQGKVQIMWGIGKPVIVEDSVFFAFTKLGKYMLDNGEGWFFCSDNILTESDPSAIRWRMLPDGDRGLCDPQYGSVQEEHNLVALENGDLYCMYRTTIGHPVCSYSRDRGRTWSAPTVATYTPAGREFKHPRACPRIWKAKNGKYLFWFHNHGGKDYNGRNPAWLSGGIEKDGFIHWSQPEILLYDDDPSTRMSYPDLIEQDGEYWITETQKTVARVHRVDASMLHDMWNQSTDDRLTTAGLVLRMNGDQLAENEVDMPSLGDLSTGDGFSLDFWLRHDSTRRRTLFDSRNNDGKGINVESTASGELSITLSNGSTIATALSDPQSLSPGAFHHVVIIVDGGPKIITFVIDGRLCDGGDERTAGWTRFASTLADVNSAAKLRVPASPDVTVKLLRIYDRYLRTSEAIANHNHDRILGMVR